MGKNAAPPDVRRDPRNDSQRVLTNNFLVKDCRLRYYLGMVKFTAHCLVKNEDLWIWYALQSVIDYAEEIIIYDTGSTDRTVEAINSIKSPKIKLSLLGAQSREALVKLRNQQIAETKTPWFLILDGDEIWPKEQISSLLYEAENTPSGIKAFVNKTKICLGDAYHYLPDSGGQYSIAGRKGNFNIRLIKKTGSLTVKGLYPLEAYCDENGPVVGQPACLQFSNAWYLHMSLLKRSSVDSLKRSGSFGKRKLWERGEEISSCNLPEVLHMDHPLGLNNPLIKRGLFYEFAASLLSPIIKIKRRLEGV